MTDRTPTTLFSSLFALLFVASLAVAGCAGTLTAPQPEAQPAPTPAVVAGTDVEAPHNHSKNANGGGGTSGAADHNFVGGE